jgi:hypothetical protein
MKRRHGRGPVSHVAGAGLSLLVAEYVEAGRAQPSDRRAWQAATSDVKIRRVCIRCNNGWLARLEGAVRPVLTPLILGTRRVVLTSGDQTLVARWSVKTATLLRYVRRPFDPPSNVELRWIRDHEMPPPQVGVWLGAYGGSAQAYGHLGRYDLEPPENLAGPPFHAELAALTFGRLVVLVLQFPDAERDLAIGTTHEVFSRFTVKIWPPPGFHVRWPPLLGVDDDGLSKLSQGVQNGLIQVFTEAGVLGVDRSRLGGS